MSAGNWAGTSIPRGYTAPAAYQAVAAHYVGQSGPSAYQRHVSPLSTIVPLRFGKVYGVQFIPAG